MSALHRVFTAKERGLLQKSSERATAAAASVKTFHVAVQGCSHGELSRIYEACSDHEQQTGKKIDLLICCGDFQCVRTEADMASMAVPEKYKTVGDFPLYYTNTLAKMPFVTATENMRQKQQQGQNFRQYRQAPYLTIFIGGNHENSDWLAEESYGGFVAPNIYYLGHSGVIIVDELLCIAGLSGIFKDTDYQRPYPPRPYWSREAAKRSAYHVRRIEVDKLRAFIGILREERTLRTNAHPNVGVQSSPQDTSSGAKPPLPPLSYPLQVDVMLSHDWPAGITKYGDEPQLLRYKPYFKDEVARNALGNPHTLELLHLAQPQHWFAAHLHCFFQATVPHRANIHSSSGCPTCTHFTALDKCSKGKGFMDFFDISVPLVHEKKGGPVRDASSIPSFSFHGGESERGGLVFEGMHRIRRHPLWVEILKASHAYVAPNLCGSVAHHNSLANVPTPSWSRGTFDFDRLIENWSCRGGHSGGKATPENVEGVLDAPTTAALLAALHLHPVEPLQVSVVQGITETRGAVATSSAEMVVRDLKRGKMESDESNRQKAEETTVITEQSLGWAEDLSPS